MTMHGVSKPQPSSRPRCRRSGHGRLLKIMSDLGGEDFLYWYQAAG
ncbi:hypothetical protein HMPREF0591_0276 [Mycobacterium parascrofulaceum ATCC BAA-614]|uniref:Uncharacterized protein n=1 Tax=Mycobacterium parascrofulaceum ATCC BAA-614 TaxID=525368 RepID=D5P282_9MYCO|nr:hypothetical protein HMPREF0591_0276 [Mycobacterium parascrofulaceum ATCC BAA-614]